MNSSDTYEMHPMEEIPWKTKGTFKQWYNLLSKYSKIQSVFRLQQGTSSQALGPLLM